jgi:predicted GTPase
MDLPEAGAHLARFQKEIKEEILPVSALAGEGLTELVQRVRKVLCSENSQDK